MSGTYSYKQARLKPSPTTYFPDELMDPSFDGKRVYIKIFESKTLSSIEKVIKEGITKEAKALQSSIMDVVESGDASMLKIANEIAYFNGTEKMTLALPLPNEFQDTQSHSFNTGTGMIRALTDSIGVSSTISNALGKIAANTSSQKVMANPGYFQNYTGSEPRQFSFTFKLIPNSLEEAKKIQSIILSIKKYSSPSLKSGVIMIAPNFFWFYFSNPILQNLTGIRPCIITNISTNYAGSGILETTFDGMPKFIELSISISELRTLTQDKWG